MIEPISDMEGVPASSSCPVGYTLAGRYRLEKLLGRGAMGEVWLARDVEHADAPVAIKLLLPVACERMPRALERFRFEAQVSSRLATKTPHVVGVHDAGSDPVGGAYLVMEYVEGRTLREELCARGTLSPEQAATVLDQVAAALALAHGDGILHRDLKPSNLLLVDTPVGGWHVQVTDFGLAKAIRHDVTLDLPRRTTTGTVLGTLSYMSPEQVQALPIDERTDLWSLATIIYEALVGRTPFHGVNWGHFVTELLLRPSPPPSSYRRDLPRGLDAWFARALAKDPANRFASAPEMAAAFRRALVDDDAHAHALALAAARTRRRALGRAAMAGATALVMAGGLALLWPAQPSANASNANNASNASNASGTRAPAEPGQPGAAGTSAAHPGAGRGPGPEAQPAAMVTGAAPSALPAATGAPRAQRPRVHRAGTGPAKGDESATF